MIFRTVLHPYYSQGGNGAEYYTIAAGPTVKKSTKRWMTIVTAALVAAGGAFVVIRLISPPKDLRGALAAALHVPKSRDADFFINLPPAGSRYPGAIVVAPQ